jgi:endonuclease-3
MIPPGSGAAPVPFLLDFLARAYPYARVVLHYQNEYELLVATVLAAQCTDDRVNQVTPALFSRYPGPEEILAASQEEIEEAIRPTGFYRNKARALKGVADALVTRHGGRVPKSMEELTALPGVGRKTAAILLGACFGVDALPVDTHVGRVSFRLGLTRSKDPVRIEEDLSKGVPKKKWWEFATRLGWHGRQICVARRPTCSACGLSPVCPRIGVTRYA